MISPIGAAVLSFVANLICFGAGYLLGKRGQPAKHKPRKKKKGKK